MSNKHYLNHMDQSKLLLFLLILIILVYKMYKYIRRTSLEDQFQRLKQARKMIDKNVDRSLFIKLRAI